MDNCVKIESETREYRGQQFEITVYLIPAEFYRNTSRVDRREVCVSWTSEMGAEEETSVEFSTSVPVEDIVETVDEITVPVLGWTIREGRTEVVEETMPYDEQLEYTVSEWKQKVDNRLERIERAKQ